MSEFKSLQDFSTPKKIKIEKQVSNENSNTNDKDQLKTNSIKIKYERYSRFPLQLYWEAQVQMKRV